MSNITFVDVGVMTDSPSETPPLLLCIHGCLLFHHLLWLLPLLFCHLYLLYKHKNGLSIISMTYYYRSSVIVAYHVAGVSAWVVAANLR